MTHLINPAKLARLVSSTHHPKFSLLRFSTITTTQFGGKQSPATKHRRVELPKELSKNVIKLSCKSTAKGGVCDVYVVGTIHISEESRKQVEEIVKFLKPEIVFLELCLSSQDVLFCENIKVPTVDEMIAIWKKKRNIFGILYSWFLAECGRELGVYPGAEFRSAYREANKYGGKVVLGDRPVEITSKRTWRKLPLWHILRLLINPSSTPSSVSWSDFSSFSDNLKNLLKEDIDITQVKETMSKTLPTVIETLVHERDQYMSYTLLKVASVSRTVVAVVGRGHLEGIKNNWKQPVNIKDLQTVPPPKPVVPAIKIFAYVGVVMAGVAIISRPYL